MILFLQKLIHNNLSSCTKKSKFNITKLKWIVSGGKTGQESIRNGVFNLKDELSMALVNNNDWVKAIGSLRRKTSLTLSDGKELIEIMRNTKSIPEKYESKYPLEDRSKYEDKSSNAITCPYCHSTNTKKISGISKAGSVALFGVFAVGKVSKQWHCNNCNSDF